MAMHFKNNLVLLSHKAMDHLLICCTALLRLFSSYVYGIPNVLLTGRLQSALVDKPRNTKTHQMAEGCFSCLFFTLFTFIYQPL